MKPKKSIEKINEMLDANYGTVVSLAGAYHGRKATCLFYCHKCDQWFWQSIWSLSQGYRTRCLCNHTSPLPQDSIKRTESGHRCLPEWECYDRVRPEQRKSPDIDSEGQQGVV